MNGSIRRSARAKVNLRLKVFGREEGGYHSLETLLLRLDLADSLSLTTEPGGIRLEVGGEERDGVPTAEANLCWRAAELFYAAAGNRPAVSIRLEKRIPPGSGLGGGSADAAGTLHGLNELHGCPLSSPALLEIASELGSDVPFCLSGAPFALGWERGRRLLPLAPPPPRPVLVIVPCFAIPTAEAYGWLGEERAAGSRPRDAATLLPPPGRLSDWTELARLAENDFEDPVFQRHPELAGGKIALVAAGARIGLLCGSGSAVFAVFDDERARAEAIDALSPSTEFRLIPTRTAGPDAPGG